MLPNIGYGSLWDVPRRCGFLTFLLICSRSSLLLGDSSIVIGVLVGIWGFPCLVLLFFLVLKYRGVCLYPFFLDFMGVLKEARAEVHFFSVGWELNLSCFGDISSSCYFYYSFCYFSISSSFCGSPSICTPSSFPPYSTSSSSFFASSSSSPTYFYPSSSSTLKVGFSPGARTWVSWKDSMSISLNVD